MFTDKSKVLADAPTVLNKPEQSWEVKVEGNSIVASWKWQDAAFAATHATKDFTFTVTLNDKGKWKERELLGHGEIPARPWRHHAQRVPGNPQNVRAEVPPVSRQIVA